MKSIDYIANSKIIKEYLIRANDSSICKVRAEVLDGETKFFKKNINDSDVLVVGSGLGHDSFKLAEHNEHVTGVEICPDYVEYAKKEARRRNISNVLFEVQDFLNTPISLDEIFDYSILNMGTIGNFEDDDKLRFVKKMLDITKMKVFLDFYPPSKENLQRRLKMYQEEGIRGLRIEGDSLKGENTFSSESISRTKFSRIIRLAGAKVKYYNLCSFAVMAEVWKD